MGISLQRLLTVTSIFLLSTAPAFAGDNDGNYPSSVRGPIFDITHLDVIPLTENGVDFEKTAYTALFQYRDASKSDPGFESFRVVNWLLASNHLQIIDAGRSLDAFEAHLAAAQRRFPACCTSPAPSTASRLQLLHR